MIAVDTSALLAILFNEPEATTCMEVLATDTNPLISAATMAEAYIVARGRGVLARLIALLEATPATVVDADDETAARVSAIYSRWGKGYHPARLNLVDCFSYDVARQFGCPLLYIGNDFSQTDIPSVFA